MLEITHLTVSYGPTVIINDLSFVVPAANTLAVVGPSGAGKSTLLHSICGLIRTQSGTISVNGHDVSDLPPHRRKIGLVSQTGDLFPTMTVEDNIAFGLRMQKMPASQQRVRVTEMLALVKLEHLRERHINELSGGQARRIALVRAIAPAPHVLLLDEPLTGLDSETRSSLAVDLAETLKNAQIMAVLVTHDLDDARTLSQSILTI